MSATPTKSSKRGRKKDGGCNDRCRFCSCSFENSGSRASFENLFSKSARKESPGTVLADCCSSMGFPLIKSPSVSERVCRSCGRKIRNASELYRFIQTAPPPPLPNPPPLFLFLPIPYPLPLSTPATQATDRRTLCHMFLKRRRFPSRFAFASLFAVKFLLILMNSISKFMSACL